MVKNAQLLIDAECPMCNIYGQCFKQMGWVEPSVLTTYQSAPEAIAEKIDMERAKSEIALYDTVSDTTRYGLDALIHIVSQNRKWMDRILHFPLFFYPLLFLYRMFSFNRKVIAPARAKPSLRECAPTVHLGYRWFYIIFVACFTGWILNAYTFHLNGILGWPHDWTRELYVCIGQIIWQGVAITFLDKSKFHQYLGNMSTVSMIGGLLLIPIIFIGSNYIVDLLPWLFCFGGVVGVMFIEHIRRCKLIGISLWMTFSWVMYRTVVLAIILFL